MTADDEDGGKHARPRRGLLASVSRGWRVAIAVAAVISTVTTLLVPLGFARRIYAATWGKDDVAYETLEALRVGVQRQVFDRELGGPDVRRTDDGFTEYLYLEELFAVRVLADDDDNVRLYSVTPLRTSFRPQFRWDRYIEESVPAPVTLGETTFGELPRSLVTMVGAEGQVGAHNWSYSEIYYMGNPGGYQFFVFSNLDSGVGREPDLIGAIVDLESWGFRTGAADRTEENVFAEPPPEVPDVVESARRSSLVNTYSVVDMFFFDKIRGTGVAYGPDELDTRPLKDV